MTDVSQKYDKSSNINLVQMAHNYVLGNQASSHQQKIIIQQNKRQGSNQISEHISQGKNSHHRVNQMKDREQANENGDKQLTRQKLSQSQNRNQVISQKTSQKKQYINNFQSYTKKKKQLLQKCQQDTITAQTTDIQRQIPFLIDTQHLISTDYGLRIYKCFINDRFIEVQTLVALKNITRKFQWNKKYMQQELTHQIYQKQIQQNRLKRHIFQDRKYNQITSELKCKIVNVKEINKDSGSKDLFLVKKYLYLLRGYYTNKFYLKSKRASSSTFTKNSCEKFRFASFLLQWQRRPKYQNKNQDSNAKSAQIKTEQKGKNNQQKQSALPNIQKNELNNIQHQSRVKSQTKVNTQASNQKIKQISQIVLPVQHEYLIREFQYSLTQSSYLNENISQYAQYNHQRTNQKYVSAEINKADPQFLYIINQYHHGHTLKELILRNWEGFEDYKVVDKLATKLFWLQVQLASQGFNMHIPTLENVIINDNIKNADVNINMVSFLSTIFLLDPGNSHSKIKHKDFKELVPFLWKQQPGISIDQNKQTPAISKLDRKSNFLSLLLFMLCRRLGIFDNFEQLRNCIKQKLQQQNQAQLLIETRSGVKTEPKTLQKYMPCFVSNEKDKIDKSNILNMIHIIPKFYQKFINRSAYVEKITNIQKIQYQNANCHRIRSYQNHLGIKKDSLLDVFWQILVRKQQLASKSGGNCTWRQIYCLLFLGNKNNVVESSYLLNLLCAFYEYPKNNQEQSDWIPPEIHFALKYNINHMYFSAKFNNRWFQCFQLQQSKSKTQYDIQVMSLLKNIKSQLIEQTINIVSQINLKYNPGYICNNQKYNKLYQRLKSSFKMLRYLQQYQRHVYIKEIVTKVNLQEREQKMSQGQFQVSRQGYLSQQFLQNHPNDYLQHLKEVIQTLNKYRRNNQSINDTGLNHATQT